MKSQRYEDIYIDMVLCIATDCMLGVQPNHGWQLCFPL